jgi:hypothetical protein
MELNECIIVFKDDNRYFGATVQGIITATHNDNGGGLYVQPTDKSPGKINFDQILSLTIIS